MAGKKVIFCEGVHDLILISILLDQRQISWDKITYDELLDLRQKRQRDPESNKIRDFLKTVNGHYKFLIKEESGFPRCIDNFIYLYGDKTGDQFKMLLILDSGNFESKKPLTKLKKDSVDQFHKDILDKKSENFYETKDKWKHRIFFIPLSLESQVQSLMSKNLDFDNRDELYVTLKEFVNRAQNVDWFLEFQAVLFS
jgi:hypothetical protein